MSAIKRSDATLRARALAAICSKTLIAQIGGGEGKREGG